MAKKKIKAFLIGGVALLMAGGITAGVIGLNRLQTVNRPVVVEKEDEDKDNSSQSSNPSTEDPGSQSSEEPPAQTSEDPGNQSSEEPPSSSVEPEEPSSSAEPEEPVIQQIVLGVAGEPASDGLLTRTDDAVTLHYSVDATNGTVSSDFDDVFPYSEITEVEYGGNTFVRIPKHYTKYTWDAGTKKKKTQISNIKDTGYVLNPCFMDDEGNELDYIDVAKYQATGSSSKATSVSGGTTLTNINIDQMRTACLANNTESDTGYQQLDIHTWAMLQDLWKIEFANTNSQFIMAGNTNGSKQNAGVGDSIELTGWDLTTGVMVYRGIENLYGNVRQWCDGVSFSNYQAYVCTEVASYQGGKIDGDYHQMSYALASGSGNPSEIGFDDNYPHISFATQYNGTDYTNGGFYYDYSSFGYPCLYVGGSYANGANAGLFYANSYNATTASDLLGGRMLHKPVATLPGE